MDKLNNLFFFSILTSSEQAFPPCVFRTSVWGKQIPIRETPSADGNTEQENVGGAEMKHMPLLSLIYLFYKFIYFYLFYFWLRCVFADFL